MYYKALLKKPFMVSKYGNMQYKVGESFTITGELKIGRNGLHFCDNIAAALIQYDYDFDNIVICEVIPFGKIVTEEIKYSSNYTSKKYCSEGLTIVRQLSYDEIITALIDSNHFMIRAIAVRHMPEKYLDQMVSDDNWLVRYEVAKIGRPKDLDFLVLDESYSVRMCVLNHKIKRYLKILADDANREIAQKAKRLLLETA